MHLMLSISGQTPYPVILRACPNTNLRTSSRQKKRQQQQQHDENSKRQKLQHQQQYSRLPPIQQSGHGQPQIRPGPNPPLHTGTQVAGAPSHHYGKPRGPSAGPQRYPPNNRNPSGGYNNPNRGQGDSGYNSGPYPPQGRAPPYGSTDIPGGGGPRGGGGSGYSSGGLNYPHGSSQYGASGAGRGSNMMSGSRNQQYNW